MASKKDDQPILTQQHLSMLNDVLRLNNEATDLLHKCKECKINVEKEESILKEQRELATRLKKQFFPKAK